MSGSTCPRSFEVEALHEGRLNGVERARFERHLALCKACSHEAEQLAALARKLRASHLIETDELQLRRERTRLLAAFDESLAPRSDRIKPLRRAAFGLALAAGLLGAGAVLWGTRRTPAPVPAPAPAPALVAAAPAVIRGDSAAAWSRRTRGDREEVVLERGTLWIRVHDAAARLLILLPDGELEDTGTTFSVTVDGASTTRVAVEEGSVRLRLRGHAVVTIMAGQIWSATPPAASSSGAEPGVELGPASQPGTPTRSLPRAPASAAVAAPVDQAALEFRAGVAAFKTGDARDAAAKLDGFLQRFPRDPRAEDAAYLRVLSLRKAGDRGAAKAAADDYLRRFPHGFRRSEVEALAH